MCYLALDCGGLRWNALALDCAGLRWNALDCAASRTSAEPTEAGSAEAQEAQGRKLRRCERAAKLKERETERTLSELILTAMPFPSSNAAQMGLAARLQLQG
jgi:hypothetical protein